MRRMLLCLFIFVVFLSQSSWLTDAFGMSTVHRGTALSIEYISHSHEYSPSFSSFNHDLHCTDLHTHCLHLHGLGVLLNTTNFIPKLARLKQIFVHGDRFRFTSAITAPLDRPNWLTLFNFLY